MRIRSKARTIGALALFMLAGSAEAQLVVGNDNAADGNLWVIDLAGGVGTRRLLPQGSTDAQPWGVAADPATNTLYWLDGGSRLMKATMTSTGELTPIFVGSTTVNGASANCTGIAFDTVDNKLIGYRSVTAVGLYEINVNDATMTQITPITGDYGGIDYDPATDSLIACNDATTGPGRGIVRIAKPFSSPTLTLLAPYPAGDTDIDGAAINGNLVYMVNDTAAQGVFVYNLTTNAYEATIPLPFTGSAGTFSAGAWAPALVAPIVGVDLQVSASAPANCTVGEGGSINYNLNVSAPAGSTNADNVVVTVTLPAGSVFASSVPAATPSGNTLTFNVGTLNVGSNFPISVSVTPPTAGVYTISATATTTSTDPAPGNNSASAGTQVIGTAPGSASIQGLITTIASASTSNVPGLDGFRYATGVLAGRLGYSSDRSRFLQAWDTDNPTTTQDQVLVAWNGSAFSVVSQEEVSPELPTVQGADVNPPPYFPFGSYDAYYDITNDGIIAFSGLDDRAGSVDDGYIVKGSGTSYTLIAQETITPATPIDGAVFAATRGSVQLSDSGAVSFYHTLIGVPTTLDTALFINNGATVVAQEGTTVPTGQAGGASEVYETFSATTVQLGFYTDATQTNWICAANLTGATTGDNVVVVNNDVKLQEGQIIAGSSFTSPVGTSFRAVRMEPEGTWFASGANADGSDYVVKDGTVIAATGEPIFTGATETWGDTSFAATFFAHAASPNGSYIVGGVTSGASDLADAVLVLNGETVIARENDPIDLNGDGIFNDDAYLRTFIDDRLFLADDAAYVTVRIRNSNAAFCGGADTDLGLALIRIPLPTTGCDDIDFNNNDVFPEDQDVIDFFNVLAGADCPQCNDIDFNNNGVFPEDQDVIDFFNVLAGGNCP
ncbi:MAG TPA: hypothetical protein VK157_13355 [Phycisphaerales bacterium]|nr:hypothetical protein [Phycisphaerales bacterium]